MRPPPGAHALADGVTTATGLALLYKPPVAHELPPGFTALARPHRPLLAAVATPAAALPEQGPLAGFGCVHPRESKSLWECFGVKSSQSVYCVNR